MITETAEVIAVQGDQAQLRVLRHTTCSGCQQAAGCATQTISGLFSARAVELSIQNSLQARVGDYVLLGVEEKSLLRVALRVYLYPLLGMFACLLLGRGFGLPIALDPMMAVLGLAMGLFVQHLRKADVAPPKMLKHLPSLSIDPAASFR